MAHIEGTARAVISVIADNIRKKTEPIFRHHILMAALRSHGRITYGHGGLTFTWRPRVMRRALVPGAGNVNETTFSQTNTRIKCELPYRVYEMGESVTKMERLATQNQDTALFKIAETVVNEMSEDFVENFNAELFVDGNDASTNKQIHGLESMFAIAANPNEIVNDNSSDNGVVGDPDDTYAGHSTALGELGGDWTPDTDKEWPTGVGTGLSGAFEYHAYSPMVVDYNNSNLGGTTANWANQWQHALNFLLTYGESLQQQTFDLILLNPELMRVAKDSLIGKERFVVSAKTQMTDLGFKTLSYEGTELHSSFGVPSGVGYGLRFDKMELRSMQSQLVMPADDFDITTSEKLHKLDCYCNMRFETPAFFGKLQGISTAGT